MLQHTFCHISGLGAKTEKKLWEAGIHNWGQISCSTAVRLSPTSRADLAQTLEESLTALENNPKYFTKKLASTESWRIFNQFRDQSAYIDIETTGLSDDAEITTIAVYDGKKIMHYIQGHNLDDFVRDIRRYKVLISYSGTGFDLPVIERYFKIKLDHAHIDLRYVLASLGIRGGLKGCEKQIGIDRGDLDGINGCFAITLWRAYQLQGDQAALQTLVAYNIEDSVNLERLMVEAYNRKLLATPFAAEMSLPSPKLPVLPFQADRDCIRRLGGGQ
ncbi:ribonuclease H-like domain-containing protein [Desulfotalea psychrophila]|uniref:YprB ribonuclease H-like domain-containing protein n=1 Tax=Desulfotalea psychrophila (strain LSv54 / DSM 12343) TaxID=177439 RepID=Q6ASD2_DESPS|nr:ribonuclease H-like domain-containing protein [Desulfotalea psychrophila]CAG34731.1 conserved hypothetical protein [Desulfotalea psychrophila LSv54]